MEVLRDMLKRYECDDYGFGDDMKIYLKPRPSSGRVSKKSLSAEERSNIAELRRLELAGGKIKRQMASQNGSLGRLEKSDIRILDDLLKVEQLAELIGVVCEEDAPWGAPIAEPAWGRDNKVRSLQVLDEQTTATYGPIKSREDQLIKLRKDSEQVEESLNELCGRAQKIQKDLGPIQQFFKERGVTLQKEAEEAEAKVLEKVSEHIKARIAYEGEANAIKRKRENNATIFHSIGTLFSDVVSLTLSLHLLLLLKNILN